MTVTKTTIVNESQASLGQEAIASITATNDPQARHYNSIFDGRLKFLLGAKTDQKGNGWVFNRTRTQLTRVYKLTLAAAPAPASFAVGATLTGATSGVTCTVQKVESSTVYWVTAPSGNGFTDGENIGDGTNTAAGAADYPEIDETPAAFGGWAYCFALPSDYLANLRLIGQTSDEIDYPWHREGALIFANVEVAYARYSMDLTDLTRMPGWFTNLLAMDLARKVAPKFIGQDRPYVTLDAKRNLEEAWMDALSGNGGDSYAESAGRETQGNTDVYEGARLFDLPETEY
jgi:hypothetical protein